MTANVRRFVILALCDTKPMDGSRNMEALLTKLDKRVPLTSSPTLLQYSPFPCDLGELESDTVLFSEVLQNTL